MTQLYYQRGDEMQELRKQVNELEILLEAAENNRDFFEAKYKYMCIELEYLHSIVNARVDQSDEVLNQLEQTTNRMVDLQRKYEQIPELEQKVKVMSEDLEKLVKELEGKRKEAEDWKFQFQAADSMVQRFMPLEP